ncbi:XdhC family protein [Thermogemmatispora sp.]|uniref:XdhC family protein n=1 Tax=Thermogemmatispora sp. TaxID=1968838 RepID=UPI001DF8E77C|nr:XdhC/CoxI family protein [Thermogemmatispora sp.]MBX5449787.1 XdhC family protein [Thermogemmatispora sp.]
MSAISPTAVYEAIQTALQRGERIGIATVVKTIGAAPCDVGARMLLHADGSASGSFGGGRVDEQAIKAMQQALQEGHSFLTHIHIDPDEAVGSCGATLEVFVEAISPEPRLIIAGAGHVAQALARFAADLDFRIIVVDDRRDLADPRAFGERVQLVFGDIAQTIRELRPDASTWVVIVTRGHRLDEEALRAAVESEAAYVGMIGSAGKIRNIFRNLLKAGIPRERLEQVHTPIGLDIGAVTPQEIALSIAAELVMTRRTGTKGTGAPLKTLHHLIEEVAPVTT